MPDNNQKERAGWYFISRARFPALDENLNPQTEAALKTAIAAFHPHEFPEFSVTTSEDVQFVFEKDIPLGKIPAYRIHRMSKRKYVEDFFHDGSIRLGSFGAYRNIEHSQMGDTNEGVFMYVSRPATIPGRNGLIFHDFDIVTVAGGENFAILCSSIGEVDPVRMKSFDSDAAYEILDIVGFATAIEKKLSAISYTYSECIYAPHRVLRTNKPIAPDIDQRLFDVIGITKYFLKPEIQRSQQEFRILWDLDYKLEGFVDIKCPEAIKFCRRLI